MDEITLFLTVHTAERPRVNFFQDNQISFNKNIENFSKKTPLLEVMFSFLAEENQVWSPCYINFERVTEFIICYCFCLGQQNQLINWKVNSQGASRWQLWFKFCEFPNQHRIFVLCLIKKLFIKICLKLSIEQMKMRIDNSVR